VGREWVSKVQAKDGGKSFRTARVNCSTKGPAKIAEVVRAAGEAMGVDLGNLLEKISGGSLRKPLTEWVNGMVLSGRAEQQFDKLMRSLGFTWSIQGGALQISGPTDVIGTKPVLLTSSSGMIGAPEPGEKGIVKVKSLLQPNLTPGRAVEIRTKNDKINGVYRIQKATFTGDTWGGDWGVDIEGKPIT